MAQQFKPLHERYDILPNGCWTWTSYRDTDGYGVFTVGGRGGRQIRAHRYFFEWFKSVRIPPGMTIDHLCKNRACVNPQHLEVVTSGVNSRRGLIKKECKRGHPRSGDNLYITPDGGRQCRACNLIRARINYRKRTGSRGYK